jgi:hypothetical protein
MANTLGTLSPSELVLDCIQFLKLRFPILTAVATDFSNAAVKYNQQVISRVVTPIAAADYSTTTGYAATATTVTDVPVTINKHKHVSVSFNEQELSGTPRNLIAEQTEAAAYSLGLQMSNDLWALCTAANFATNTPVNVANVAAINRTEVLAIREALVKAGATNQRNAIVSAEVFAGLAADPTVYSTLYGDRQGQTNVDYDLGTIIGLAGFGKIVEFSGMPAGSSPYVRGYFGGKEGLLIASRVPADPGTWVTGVPVPALIGVESDPETGLSIQYRYMYDPFKGFLQMTLTVMYGVAVGVAGHAVVVTTTA